MELAAIPAPLSDALPILAPLAGSLAWQIILLLLAGLFLFSRLIRGMQLGGARQLVSLMALVMGIATAWTAGPALVPVMRGFLGIPDFAVRAIGSSVACLLVIGIVEILGMIFCAKTEEQKDPKTRRLYAMTGIVLGLLNGVITLVIVAAGLNLLGTVANTQLYSQINQLNQSVAANPPVRDPNAPARETDGQNGPVTVTTTVGNPVAVFLARLKNSADLGLGKTLMSKVDPIPPNVYRTLQKAVKVLADPACVERLLQHPDVSRLTQHELIAKLAQDEEIRKLAQSRDLMGLMRNEKLVAAANDPDIQKDFSSVDIEAALDYALAAHKDTLSGSIENGEVTLGTQR